MPVFECSTCNELTYSASAGSDQACARCGSTRQRVLDGGFANARDGTRDLGPGDHATHVYDDPTIIGPFCVRYLTEGVDRDERVMAAVPEDLREVVQSLLAPDVAVLVEWEDPHLIYGDFNTERIAAMYDALIGGEPRTMRILAVIDRVCVDGVDPAELDRYEAIAHGIVTRHGATAICMYDTRGLDPAHLEASARRHTLRMEDGSVWRNEDFEYAPA